MRTQNEIIEGNKLIAEFMGMKKGHPDADERRWKNDWFESLISAGNEFETRGRHSEPLKFDSSWDWLMPVVGKIESLGYWVNFIDGDVFIYQNVNLIIPNPIHFADYKKIDICWIAVVEFIKWYNNNK